MGDHQRTTLSSEDIESLQAMAATVNDLNNYRATTESQLQAIMAAIQGLQVNPPNPPAPSPQITNTPPVTTSTMTSHHREPKMNNPAHFDGKRSELSDFLTQLRMIFRAQPSKFSTEDSKVMFAASFLRGTAFRWIQPQLEKDPLPYELSTFSSFAQELKRVFGDPEEVATAERTLTTLKQIGSASAYASKFMRISSSVEWNDSALRYQFYSGLKDIIKDELCKLDRPESLAKLMEIAIRIDNRIHERRLEKGPSRPPMKTTTTQVPAPSTFQLVDRGPQPMDIDAARRKFKPLSEEEKQRRRMLNLCLYCGQPGHQAMSCPNKGRPTQVSSATTSQQENSFPKED